MLYVENILRQYMIKFYGQNFVIISQLLSVLSYGRMCTYDLWKREISNTVVLYCVEAEACNTTSFL